MAKTRIELEYHFNTKPKVLFPRLSTVDGLNEWFADDVQMEENVYTFKWGSEERSAEILYVKDLKTVRFKWLDDDDESVETYFEFSLSTTELTDDLALEIVDYTEDDEVEEMQDLWNAQITTLKRILGA